jgi:hypothetical protein
MRDKDLRNLELRIDPNNPLCIETTEGQLVANGWANSELRTNPDTKEVYERLVTSWNAHRGLTTGDISWFKHSLLTDFLAIMEEAAGYLDFLGTGSSDAAARREEAAFNKKVEAFKERLKP